MATFYKAPSANYISTTLNGSIDNSVDTITLTSVTNLQAPGILVIDREDGNGTATPNSREIISFTGISTNDLTGCTRGFDNSTARSHSDGALVEAVFTVGMWNDLRNAVSTAMLTNGTGINVSTATVTDLLTAPSALISTSTILGIANINELVTTAVKNSVVTLASAATVDVDVDTGNIFRVVMPDSEMGITVSNDNDEGQVLMLDIVQRSQASAPTVVWPGTVKWVEGTRPQLTSGSDKIDTIGFRVESSGNYLGYVVGQNL